LILFFFDWQTRVTRRGPHGKIFLVRQTIRRRRLLVFFKARICRREKNSKTAAGGSRFA